ncbi:MAG: hypothetical protein ACYTAN_07745 [Planctomycetota bacterium]|jgi:hypothetical protein
MQTQVVLTSSQSKRLIAKGIVKWQPFKEALRSGIVAICKGTTDAYICEELLGPDFEKWRYVTGRTGPAGGDTSWARADLGDVVLENGDSLEGVSVTDVVSKMGPGDIFLKGANAMNYDLGQAAVLIGHPTGGTVGAALGTMISRKVRLVHPTGLEKNIPGDLPEAVRRLAEEDEAIGETWGLWATHGELFTEIEAIDSLFNLEAVPIGAGGIAGAEGSVTLALFGERSEIDKALRLIGEIQKEPPFSPPSA